MKKEFILKSNDDFQRIIQNTRPYKYKGYIVYVEKNNSNEYHFGFSVGKKIGNAVLRNKIKRQLRMIVSKKHYQNGFNCIIIVSNSILKLNYFERETYLWEILKKLGLMEEKNEK